MNPSFAQFEAEARSEGFDEVLERVWPPDTVLTEHTHPFAVKALMVKGEMWLTVGNDTLHLLPGHPFSVAREQPHSERYGPVGATYWVARRSSE